MLSADGNMLDNGASGYLLRDKGMRLDNLSLTLTTFLGANVACAQCHDHPFADWTQKQFYEMAAFMGGGGAGPKLAGRMEDVYPDIADQIAVIANGRGSMPAFGSALTPEQIEAVAKYEREVL